MHRTSHFRRISVIPARSTCVARSPPRALRSLADIELDAVTLTQILETLAIDCALVEEVFLPCVVLDEPEPLVHSQRTNRSRHCCHPLLNIRRYLRYPWAHAPGSLLMNDLTRQFRHQADIHLPKGTLGVAAPAERPRTLRQGILRLISIVYLHILPGNGKQCASLNGRPFGAMLRRSGATSAA